MSDRLLRVDRELRNDVANFAGLMNIVRNRQRVAAARNDVRYHTPREGVDGRDVLLIMEHNVNEIRYKRYVHGVAAGSGRHFRDA